MMKELEIKHQDEGNAFENEPKRKMSMRMVSGDKTKEKFGSYVTFAMLTLDRRVL